MPRFAERDPEILEMLQKSREDIGNQLREARDRAGLSTRQLDEIVGLQYNHISRIEQGRYNVTVDTLSLLGNALGFEIKLTPKQQTS